MRDRQTYLRDTMQIAVEPKCYVCLSVCLSVTLVFRAAKG